MSTAIKARPPAARQIVPGRASASHSLKALALYASIIGRQAGVDIVFGNYPTAATDGKKIYLPSLVNVAEAKWIVILRALIDHEVMHVRQTKFETIKDCNSPLSKVLSNILEDCWGEREQAKVYPGSLKAIRAGMDELVALNWFSAPPANVSSIDPRGAFVNWLLHDLRGRHFVMPDLTAWGQQWRALAEPAFGAQLLDSVLALMYEVDSCTSSAKAVNIANRVVDLLREQQQQLQQQAQQQREQPAAPAQPDQAQDAGEESQQPQAGGAGENGQEGQPQADDAASPAEANDPTDGESEGGDGADSGDGADGAQSAAGQGAGSAGDDQGAGSQGADAAGASGDGSNSPASTDRPQGAGSSASGDPSVDASQGAGEVKSDEAGQEPSKAAGGGNSADGQPSSGSQGEIGRSAPDVGADPSASDDRIGGTQGSNTSKASGDVRNEGEPGQTGSGAGSGWIETPEELEEQARQIGEALAAQLKELPATEMADAICAQLQEANVMQEPGKGLLGVRHASALSDKKWDLPSSPECHDGGEEELAVRSLAKNIERHLGSKLRDMLEARIQCSSTYSRRGLRVGAQRLSRAKAGSLEVFRKTEEGDELSTAISLLVDMSGSMNGGFGDATRSIGAAGAAYAIAETLGRFAVPFSWVNFGSSALSVKRFEESWRKRRSAAAMASLGGTTLDIPLLKLLPELAARDEERKLFLVITDGEPANVDDVVAVLSLMPMMGVEVAMLFIGHDGGELERKLAAQGIQVARAHQPDALTLGLFQAVENAFI